MKYIEKSKKEPQVLTEAKAGGGDYGLRKKSIQGALLQEQGHLCAYCMGRISLELNEHHEPKISIEHFLSQEKHPDKTLDYSNMLGVCNGKSGKYLHCDKTEKGKADGRVELKILNPLDKNCEKLLKYNLNGAIQSIDDNNTDVEYDLNTNLHLNNDVLRENRRIAFDIAWEKFKKSQKNKKMDKTRFASSNRQTKTN